MQRHCQLSTQARAIARSDWLAGWLTEFVLVVCSGSGLRLLSHPLSLDLYLC